MTKANKFLKISGLLYLLVALFFILYVPLVGGPLLAIGTILLSYSFLTLEELSKNKVALIIIAVLSLLFNQIAAILIFISLDEISSAKKNSINSPPEEQISSESKRIDLLLKLGLAMVLVAGILFATTSWEIISDLFKLIALLVMGGAFLGLSKFSEVKLKIENTTKAYFILGISFFILTWVGVGYFAPFSEWFSYSGGGSALVYFITFVLTSIAFYTVNYKFEDPECLYLGHASVYLSMFALLTFCGLTPMLVLLIMGVLSTTLNFIPKKEKLASLQEFNHIISFLYWPMIITKSSDGNFIILLLTSAINIFNILYIAAKTNDNAENLFAAIIGYILIFASLVNIPYDIDALLTVFIVMTAFSLIIKYNPFTKNKYLIITSQSLYHIISLIIIFMYLIEPSIESMIITGLYLLANIINSLDLTKTNDQVDFRYQPFVIFYFIFSILDYFAEKVMSLDFVIVPAICAIIYVFINFFSKKSKVKSYYLIFTIIAAIITYMINLDVSNIIASIITLLVSIYLFLQMADDNEVSKVCTYIFIILNIQALCLQILPSTYGSILSLLIYGLLILIIKDKKLDIVNYLAVVIPLITLINDIGYDYYVYKIMAINALELYVLFLVLKFFIKDKAIKDIIGTIFYSLITATIIFQGELVLGLYIGILAITIIFVTFNEEQYKKLFYTSIIITILNIIVQLWEFWGIIPFWLYLLVVGIGIIAFVTYKELNKTNEPPKPQKEVNVATVEVTQEKKIKPTKQEEISNDQLLAENSTFQIIEEKQNNSCNCEHEHHHTEQQNVSQPMSQVQVGNFCPTCGTQNKGGNFCTVCGRNLVIRK